MSAKAYSRPLVVERRHPMNTLFRIPLFIACIGAINFASSIGAHANADGVYGLSPITCSQGTIARGTEHLLLTLGYQRRDRLSLVWKSIDDLPKSCLDGAHENKTNWIDPGVLLFRSCSVLRRRSADGHLEAERSEIEDHSWHVEEHTGCLLKYVRAGENQGRWHRCEW